MTLDGIIVVVVVIIIMVVVFVNPKSSGILDPVVRMERNDAPKSVLKSSESGMDCKSKRQSMEGF